MPNYRVVEPLSGLINGREWPPVGGVIDVPEVVGEVMPELEAVETVEKRPASTKGVETRTRKRS